MLVLPLPILAQGTSKFFSRPIPRPLGGTDLADLALVGVKPSHNRCCDIQANLKNI